MKILITGGRDYSDKDFLFRFLDSIHKKVPITCIVHGCAKGTDTLAGEWAELNGIQVKRYPVTKEDWSRLGKRAGIVRNAQMLDHECPDFVVAFPGGNGTEDMIKRAVIDNRLVMDIKNQRWIRPSQETQFDYRTMMKTLQGDKKEDGDVNGE